MRPQRFQEFAVAAYADAPGVRAAEVWSDGVRRPFGIVVTVEPGVVVRHAITVQARDGDDYREPERPVQGEAPAPMDVPGLGTGEGGRVRVADLEQYLAAVLNNAGSAEIAGTYTYSGREQRGSIPGLGVTFHDGGKAFLPFVHVHRPGQGAGEAYALPSEV